MSKLSEIGMLRLIPRMLALKAVQRPIAASRSTSPPRMEQHGVSGTFPITVPMPPFSNLAHTPNFRATLGQLPLVGVGVGFWIWIRFVIGGDGVFHPLTRGKKRR